MIRAVVTVVGQDQTGIVAGIATALAKHEVNILDLSQTIMDRNFTMSMLVALNGSEDFNTVQAALKEAGEAMAVTVHVQREEIFDTMARV
ncbi:ACT domain-containing protein [Leuconostocaceae bacterium ESL0958]|nr:ACT domain-containing protein [Leuconostocaceae bacterium ESL0958]